MEKSKKIIELNRHKNAYYNLPCKYKDIINFMDIHNIKIENKVFTAEDNIYMIANPSKTGGVAYIKCADL